MHSIRFKITAITIAEILTAMLCVFLVSFSIIQAENDRRSVEMMDVIAQDDTLLEDLDLKINAEKLYRYMREVLDEREQEILYRRFGLNGQSYTQREVGRQLNISRSYVSRIEKRALEKLRERFEKGDAASPAARDP